MTTSIPNRNVDATDSRNRLSRFFFADEVPYGLAIIRMLLPLALLCAMVPRWIHARETYSADGALAPLALLYGIPNMLPVFSGTVAVAIHSVLLISLVTMSLGWCTRISLVISTVLYTYLNLLDAVSTMTKYSVIATHALLLLSLSQCGLVWSVDSWLKRSRWRKQAGEYAPVPPPPKSSAWPRRMVQLLVGFIYLGSAITKMHTPAFFSGDQLQSWILSNVNFANPLGEPLALYPSVLVVFAYITIVWEVIFIFLAWRGVARLVMLGLGVFFHVMTTVTLGLYIFPMVCIPLYFAFADEHDVEKFSVRFRCWSRRFGWMRWGQVALIGSRPFHAVTNAIRLPSLAVFAFVVAAVGIAGVEAEYQVDRYGVRRPEGPFALRELDEERVGVLLGPSEPVRLIDKLFHLQVGTIMIGEYLANPRTEFYQGEQVVAQCTLTPVHEDLWLECNLHDAHDRVVDKLGQIVPRETLRSNFYYGLSESLEPGDYYFVVVSAGTEAFRKKITLKAKLRSPVAH